MRPSDYRRDYVEYCSALERGRYEHHAGLAPPPRFEPLEERYADLWTAETIGELRRAHDETPAHFETERTALRVLVGAAGLGHLRAQTRGVIREYERCAAASSVEWGGAKVPADEVPGLVASEREDVRRRELAARWFDAVRACDDLRAARLEGACEAARALGYGSVRALHESLTGADFDMLSAGAGSFLRRTEAAYLSGLSGWAEREVGPAGAAGLRYEDGLFFGRASHLDRHFPAGEFRAACAETLAGLGIDVGAQQNVRMDAEARAGKGARSACFAVRPPWDVRFVVGSARGGADWFRSSFHEAGRAQHFGWSSRDTAERYPEFVHAPDAATGEGHASLFSGLFRDAAWLGSQRGLRETEAREAASSLALVELYEVRRACAGLRCWLDADAPGAARAERSADAYASLHTEATGFRHGAATHLLDAAPAPRAAYALRARLFAAGLREHLRGRHGRRWHTRRAAGEELIDIWNTASRHTVEELARLVWGGALSFDLLAEELIAAVDG